MPLPKFAVRVAARAKPFIPEGAWPTILAARTLVGDGPLLTPAPTGRILTLAAHPDDDTIGCAGTLALAVTSGASVTAVMATSGDASIGTSLSRQELTVARERDARKAYAHLGVEDVRFMGLPDGALPDQMQSLSDHLRDLLLQVTPDNVFVPWAHDGHPDHRALHRALLALDLPDTLTIWSYETWTPLAPNRHVDITAVHHKKVLALEAHATASEAFDISALAAMSRYRSAHALRGKGHAEGFLVGSPDELRTLLNQS